MEDRRPLKDLEFIPSPGREELISLLMSSSDLVIMYLGQVTTDKEFST